MLTDQLESNGLSVNTFSDALCTTVRPLLSSFSAIQNPVDLTAALVSQPDMLEQVTEALVNSEEFDAIIIFMGLMDSIAEQLAEGLIQLEKNPDCPVLLIWMGGQKSLLNRISREGIMVFEEIPEVVSLLAKLV